MKSLGYLVITGDEIIEVTDVKLNKYFHSTHRIHPNPKDVRCDLEIRVFIVDHVSKKNRRGYTSPQFGHVRQVCLYKNASEDHREDLQTWLDEALAMVKYQPWMVPVYKDGQKSGEVESRFRLCPKALNMKALRIKTGLSREVIVEKLDLSYPTYLEMEQCRRTLTNRVIERVMKFHKVDADRLNQVPSKFEKIINEIHSLDLEDRIFIESAIERMSVRNGNVTNTSKDPFKLMNKVK